MVSSSFGKHFNTLAGMAWKLHSRCQIMDFFLVKMSEQIGFFPSSFIVCKIFTNMLSKRNLKQRKKKTEEF
jgi:hypothetical protein